MKCTIRKSDKPMSEESVLLVYPPGHWGEIERFCQPLGILWLASILKQEGIKVKAVDLSAEGWPPNRMAKFIAQGDFTHVGTTIVTPFRKVGYDILKMTKKIDPSITTLAGGPHATYLKEKTFAECSAIDIVISGEAELDIADIIRNPNRKFYDLGVVQDINSLPIPDRSHIRHIQYNKMDSLWLGDTASMKWVRGCSWRKCTFCSRSELTMVHRRRSPEKIVEEIALLQNEMNYKNIIVVDDSLRVKSKYVKDIFRLKIKEGLDIPFWLMARADHIDDEGARLMRRAGGTGLLIGLESVVPRIIDMYRKTNAEPHTWYRKLDQAFELADKHQLITLVTLIVGAPTETEEEMWTTVDYSRQSKLDLVQPNPFIFLVGTDLWRDAIQKRQISPDQYWTYNDKSYGTTRFTTKEIFDLAVKAQNHINSPLLNPRRGWRIIRKLIKQKNWQLIGQNLARLPLVFYDLFVEHPYEVVPEELHA